MLKKLFSILFVTACASLCAADPSEQFLSAYQAYQQGEKAERDGNSAEALRKYRFAESILVEITSKDPAWQKSVIEYRLKKTREGVDRMQSGGVPDEAPSLASSSRTPAYQDSRTQDTRAQDTRAQGPSITIVPPDASSPSSGAQQKALSDSSAEVRRLKKQIDGLKSDLQEAREALTSQKNRSQDLEAAKWEEERKKLGKDLQDAKDQVANLSDRLKKRDSWEKDIKDLQKRLDDALADKAATEELYLQREKKMAAAAGELTRQLEEARQKISEGSASRQKFEGLSKEVESGRESIKQLQAKLEQAESTAKEYIAKNNQLQSQVSEVSSKLADSQKQTEELDSLRTKIKSLQEESGVLRRDIKRSGDQLASVEESSKKSAAEARKTEDALRADLMAVEEDRKRISDQADKLAEAARDAAKVKGLQKDAEELKKSVAQLQEQLAAAQKNVAEARSQADLSEKSAKEAAANTASRIKIMESDRAVLEEERQMLVDKLADATGKVGELGKRNEALAVKSKEMDQLNARLAENAKSLETAKSKLAESQDAAAAEKAEAQRKLQAAQSLKEALEQQNVSLQEQLKGSLSRMAGLVDQGSDQGPLKEQLKALQQQIDQNAKNYAESQRRLEDMTKSRPEQEKVLREKEKALADARSEAEKLRADLASANQKVTTLQQQSSQGEDRLKKLQDQLAEISKSGSAGEKAADDLRKSEEKLRAELADAKEKIASLQGKGASVKELEGKLAEKESELARLRKKKGKSGAVAEGNASDENSLLRGIVIRQVKDEAKRAQARRLMEEEMKRLNIQSQSLTEQIGVLSAPSVNLTPEERSLFKEGQLVIADDGSGKMQASVAAPMSQPDKPSGTEAKDDAVKNEQGAPTAAATPQSTGQGDTNASTQDIAWQGKFKQCIARAKEEFDRQDYLQAESSFRESLGYSPDDYFALSNLGVVEFQLGKLKEAEELLQKASQKSSDSSFALTTLGIVHYRQERMGDAEKVLRKAIVINPQDFTAHNYLGIVLAASGKGGAGESEIMKALEINPQYADAHFNLAVIYATGKPPAKMMAKKHYSKAIALGAPPDPSLEHLIQ
jgi:chromosome segregation ATPase